MYPVLSMFWSGLPRTCTCGIQRRRASGKRRRELLRPLTGTSLRRTDGFFRLSRDELLLAPRQTPRGAVARASLGLQRGCGTACVCRSASVPMSASALSIAEIRPAASCMSSLQRPASSRKRGGSVSNTRSSLPCFRNESARPGDLTPHREPSEAGLNKATKSVPRTIIPCNFIAGAAAMAPRVAAAAP